MRIAFAPLVLSVVGLACTQLNPAFIDEAGGETRGDSGADTVDTGVSASNTGDGDTGDGDTGDGDGTSGDGTTGDGTTGDGDGTTGDGDGDGDFLFECLADDSLIGCWPFDGDGLDGSSYLHHLNVSDVAYVSGLSNLAVDFSDLSLADVNTTIALSPVAMMTIEVWLYPGTRPAYTVVSKSTSYELSVDNGSLVCAFGSAGSATFPFTWAPGTWHHVACVHSGSLIQIFVDGVESSAVAALGGIASSSAALHVGSLSPSWSNWYDGKIDNLRLWSRPLSHAEICAAARATCP